MAKKFAGFTPAQLGRIVPEMAGMQADEQKLFLAANPAAARRVGMMTDKARRMVEVRGFSGGGTPVGDSTGDLMTSSSGTVIRRRTQEEIDAANAARAKKREAEEAAAAKEAARLAEEAAAAEAARQAEAERQAEAARLAQEAAAAEAARRAGETPAATTTSQPLETTAATTTSQPLETTQTGTIPTVDSPLSDMDIPTSADVDQGGVEMNYATALLQQRQQSDPLLSAVMADPTSITTVPQVAKTQATADQYVDPQIGLLTGQSPTLTSTPAATAGTIQTPAKPGAGQVEAKQITPEIQAILNTVNSATGEVGEQALIEAATMSPQQLSQLGLSAAQIEQARQVIAPDARKVEDGELIEGSTVDMDRVRTETNFEAATGAPSTDATVQGQLTSLMADFESTNPPAWAAGAMRAATAKMAARGLGASSMAGQAIVQAAMESALPIAQMDAQTSAAFEKQNLSNRQQAAMFAAEKRAEFLGLEFNQQFQARVANAAKISDIANMNFTAEQQVALENARLAQSVDLANLNARNAMVLADAAAMTQTDMANLNNRQQAAVRNAESFLQMDMANLSNAQQEAMFDMQSVTQSLFSDQSAINAAEQFNATNQQQVDQYYASMENSNRVFSAEQSNAMERFNAGEANAIKKFNAEVANLREQFNAQNSRVIAQANAEWMQKIATAETAAINEANMTAAATANGLTARAFNEIMQERRDLMSFVWQSANNDADRAVAIAELEFEADLTRENREATQSASMFSALGNLLASAIFKFF